jgi:hypothetical protein
MGVLVGLGTRGMEFLRTFASADRGRKALRAGGAAVAKREAATSAYPAGAQLRVHCDQQVQTLSLAHFLGDEATSVCSE